MNGETIMEGRCADCVLDMLQLSGRGPGKYGYCRLRRLVLEYPWAMVCQHYQYWGERPTSGHPRILLERAVHPLLDYASQKAIQVSLTPEDLKMRHQKEVDDDVKRNVGATFTARDFIASSPRKQYDLLWGFLSGFNPYNFVIAVNVFHHFAIEEFPTDKQREILDKLLSTQRTTVAGDDAGIMADKLIYAAGWALARIGRELFEYLDSQRLKRHRPDYEKNLITAARQFVNNPNIKPRRSIIHFIFGH